VALPCLGPFSNLLNMTPKTVRGQLIPAALSLYRTLRFHDTWYTRTGLRGPLYRVPEVFFFLSLNPPLSLPILIRVVVFSLFFPGRRDINPRNSHLPPHGIFFFYPTAFTPFLSSALSGHLMNVLNSSGGLSTLPRLLRPPLNASWPSSPFAPSSADGLLRAMPILLNGLTSLSPGVECGKMNAPSLPPLQIYFCNPQPQAF